MPAQATKVSTLVPVGQEWLNAIKSLLDAVIQSQTFVHASPNDGMRNECALCQTAQRSLTVESHASDCLVVKAADLKTWLVTSPEPITPTTQRVIEAIRLLASSPPKVAIAQNIAVVKAGRVIYIITADGKTSTGMMDGMPPLLPEHWLGPESY